MPKFSPERLAHYADHLDDALEMVKDYGYAGLFLGQDRKGYISQEFVPHQCIFCIHDENLNLEERLAVDALNEKNLGICRHIASHFKHLSEDDLIYCPASFAGGASVPMCLSNQPMSPIEVWTHIQDSGDALRVYVL